MEISPSPLDDEHELREALRALMKLVDHYAGDKPRSFMCNMLCSLVVNCLVEQTRDCLADRGDIVHAFVQDIVGACAVAHAVEVERLDTGAQRAN